MEGLIRKYFIVLIIGVVFLSESSGDMSVEKMFSECTELSCTFPSCTISCDGSSDFFQLDDSNLGDIINSLIPGFVCSASDDVFNCKVATAFGTLFIRMRYGGKTSARFPDISTKVKGHKVSINLPLFGDQTGHQLSMELDLKKNPLFGSIVSDSEGSEEADGRAWAEAMEVAKRIVIPTIPLDLFRK